MVLFLPSTKYSTNEKKKRRPKIQPRAQSALRSGQSNAPGDEPGACLFLLCGVLLGRDDKREMLVATTAHDKVPFFTIGTAIDFIVRKARQKHTQQDVHGVDCLCAHLLPLSFFACLSFRRTAHRATMQQTCPRLLQGLVALRHHQRHGPAALALLPPDHSNAPAVAKVW